MGMDRAPDPSLESDPELQLAEDPPVTSLDPASIKTPVSPAPVPWEFNATSSEFVPSCKTQDSQSSSSCWDSMPGSCPGVIHPVLHALNEIKLLVSTNQREISRTEQELEAAKQAMAACSSQDASVQDKQKKSQAKKINGCIKMARAGLDKLEATIAQEELLGTRADKSTHWLVIGSDWDRESGSWRCFCGHDCTPGDSWSKTLQLRHTELEHILDQLVDQRQQVLASTQKNQRVSLQQQLSQTKAQLKDLNREKRELMGRQKKATKHLAQLQSASRGHPQHYQDQVAYYPRHYHGRYQDDQYYSY
eukprot:TRINITY_DN2871_c0_g1_i1.p1 TRINITY_DN2871_c0_g1~~TRINITY_DN2871_c0_g1_i1.p1  ORF type:complete len:306 (+),score=59.64 TRINITY_DN2871_c0_g1_i1:174-1091(+)